MKISNFNRTKIVATIGPATSSYEMLKTIIEQGVDVCRLNFSHGTYDDHKKVIDNIKQVNQDLHTHVSMLLDLQGPKLRVGEMQDNKVELKQEVLLLLPPNHLLVHLKKFQ